MALWMLIQICILPIGFYYVAKAIWRKYILWNANDRTSEFRHLEIPPGDFGLPIIGETLIWAVQGSRFNSLRREKYGKVFSTNFLGKTMVKVTGPKYVKQILTASHETVTTIWPTIVRRVLGECAIANSVGSLHRYRRRVFLKAFTQEALTSYIPLIHESVKRKLSSWRDQSRTPFVYPETRELTFEVAFQVLVGLNFKDQEERSYLFKTFDTMITNLFSLPYDIPGSGFRKAITAKNVIHKILDKHVKEKRLLVKNRIEKEESEIEFESKISDAMSHILEAEMRDRISSKKIEQEFTDNGDPDRNDGDVEDHVLSDVELKDTIVEMLFAGYQTTASVATSMIINLIKAPNVFHKLEDELLKVGLLPEIEIRHLENLNGEKRQTTISYCSRNGDIVDNTIPMFNLLRQRTATMDAENNNRQQEMKNVTSSCGDANQNEPVEITLELLSSMHYLDQVFKETLRIMPPILGGYRKALKTFQLGNYRVPKGWTIIYNIRDTHESEWSEDMDFKPERFSPENWKDDRESRYRWIPFGAGSRMCVGKQFASLQLKIFIIELVRHFSKLEFAKGTPPRMFAVPFLHPTDGLPVKLTSRNQK